MYKVIRISTNSISVIELERELNNGYSIVSVNETHSDSFGFIVYVLKKDK